MRRLKPAWIYFSARLLFGEAGPHGRSTCRLDYIGATSVFDQRAIAFRCFARQVFSSAALESTSPAAYHNLAIAFRRSVAPRSSCRISCSQRECGRFQFRIAISVFCASTRADP